MLTQMNVKPLDFKFEEQLYGSGFQKCEMEIIAGNIIRISQWNDNKWFAFTWEDYQKRCKHNVTRTEKDYLDIFVEQNLLSFDGEKYHITDEFINKLKDFVKIS